MTDKGPKEHFGLKEMFSFLVVGLWLHRCVHQSELTELCSLNVYILLYVRYGFIQLSFEKKRPWKLTLKGGCNIEQVSEQLC